MKSARATSLRQLRSRLPQTIGGGRIFALPLGWLFLHLTVSSTLGQTLTHGPVVGGVTDSTANVFLRASQVPTPTATPTPTPAPPAITNQPRDATVALGQRAKFKVAASGEPPLLYQWTKNGTNIVGATQASYSPPPAVLADNGSLFNVTVSNVSGSVTSRAARLIVTSASAPASTP